MSTIFDSIRSDTPGPGRYNDVNLDLTHPTEPAFTIQNRHELSVFETPGPNAYTLPPVGDQHGCLIASRYNSPKPPDSPGPGAYKPGETSLSQQGFSFSDRHTDMYAFEHLGTPAPNEYDVSREDIGSAKGSVGFSFRSRIAGRGPFDMISVTPSPLNYNIEPKTKARVTQAETIGRRLPDAPIPEVPAPNQYPNVSETFLATQRPSAPAFTIGYRPEHGGIFDSVPSSTIPPDAYNVDKMVPNGGKITVSAVSIAGRPKDLSLQEKSTLPGPGSYFPDDSIASGSGASCSQSNTENGKGSESSLPSIRPIQRTSTYDGAKQRGGKIGTRPPGNALIRGQNGLGLEDNARVGPGTYETNVSTLDKRGGTVSARHPLQEMTLGDGPARYNVRDLVNRIKPRAQAIPMLNGRSNDYEHPFTTKYTNNKLGPAAYHLGTEVADAPLQEYSRELSSLRRLMHSDDPKASLCGRIGPSIGRRFREPRIRSTPGPGAYDLTALPSGPTFSMRTRPKIVVPIGSTR